MIREILDFAKRMLDTLSAMWDSIYDFAISPARIDIGIVQFDMPWNASWFELCFGGAIVLILGYAIVKFFTDIVL